MKRTDNLIKNMDVFDINRYWSKVIIGKENECWSWMDTTQASGHGRFSIKHVSIMAHRVSFFLATGELPQHPLMVVHLCENAACQNPEHMAKDNNSENQRAPQARKKHREGVKTSKLWWVTKRAHPRLGVKLTEQTKQKMREAALKREAAKRNVQTGSMP